MRRRGPSTAKVSGWAIRVDAGLHPETGNRRQVLRQGFPMKKAAQQALSDLIGANARGAVVTRSTITVKSTWPSRWTR